MKGNDTKKNNIHSTVVQVAKQRLLEPQFVTTVMFTRNTRGLLHFDSDYELAIKRCLPAKCIEEALWNCLFYSLVTTILKGSLKVDKRHVLRRFNDYVDKIFLTDPQTSDDGLPQRSVISTLVTSESSAKADAGQETSNLRDPYPFPTSTRVIVTNL